jgi:TrmH family RNA methyltransferase
MITSKQHRLIQLGKKLKLKKYREQYQFFLLEGERSVREVIQAGQGAHVFLREDVADRWPEFAPAAQVYTLDVVEKKVFAELVQTETPSGMAAIARKPEWKLDKIAASARLMVYLDRIADPGNLGTIMRSCLALGSDALLLSPGSVDPYNDKAIRASMGAVLHLPVLTDIAGERLQTLKADGFHLTAAAAAGSTCLYEYAFQEREILLIGSEAFGLSPEIKNISHNYIKIPIDMRSESLNAAISCAIILAEAWRQRKPGNI